MRSPSNGYCQTIMNTKFLVIFKATSPSAFYRNPMFLPRFPVFMAHKSTAKGTKLKNQPTMIHTYAQYDLSTY